MSDFYTSYETSVALRDAGAPQEAGDHDWAEQEGTEPMLVRADCFLLPGEVRGPRAFRADEIAEALTGRIDMLTPFKSGRWACRIKPASVPPGQTPDELPSIHKLKVRFGGTIGRSTSRQNRSLAQPQAGCPTCGSQSLSGGKCGWCGVDTTSQLPMPPKLEGK